SGTAKPLPPDAVVRDYVDAAQHGDYDGVCVRLTAIGRGQLWFALTGGTAGGRARLRSYLDSHGAVKDCPKLARDEHRTLKLLVAGAKPSRPDIAGDVAHVTTSGGVWNLRRNGGGGWAIDRMPYPIPIR
ncbi:MAG: hypothetical protein QOJ07_3592, partial [Thermoleophilaceae bacterium]|nr:hypothetical protein [Thermoleophilaceae bacterium]